MELLLQIFKERPLLLNPLLLAFISRGCQSEVPQIVWLKTTEMCSLTVLEAKSEIKV